MTSNSLEKALPYYKQIQHSIQESIFSGTYKPGDRLSEVQIAKQYSISRSPVREAIRALINEGLLVMDEKSQISVYAPSLQDVRDIYECRIALESAALARVVDHVTEEQLQKLESILNTTKEAIKRGDKEEIIACNTSFHQRIIQYSENNRLMKLVNELQGLTHYYRVMNIEGDERANIILKGHIEIYQAIKEKDQKKARQKLLEHTYEDLNNIVHIIEGIRE